MPYGCLREEPVGKPSFAGTSCSDDRVLTFPLTPTSGKILLGDFFTMATIDTLLLYLKSTFHNSQFGNRRYIL
jgi:hypothetical protein